MTLVAYAVDCVDIADLTTPEGRAAHGAPLDALNAPWRTLAEGRGVPPTWALHRRLLATGCAGLIVPSFAARARSEDVNAVFWRWGPTPPHQVRVVDQFARLPRDQTSWR